jgi:hypothetical protein
MGFVATLLGMAQFNSFSWCLTMALRVEEFRAGISSNASKGRKKYQMARDRLVHNLAIP